MPDDDATSSRTDPRSYTLSNQQFEYLLSGETGNRDSGELEDEIQATANNLEERLQHLAEDLSLLYQRGLLEPENQSESWDELTRINRRDGLYYEPRYVSWEREERRDVRDRLEYIKPAVHLGQVTRFLYQQSNHDIDKSLIGMGLLLGLNGGFLKDDPNDFPDTFNKRGDDPLKTIEELLDAFEGYFQKRQTDAIETEGLRTRLETIDLTHTEPLLKEADSQAVSREYPTVPSYLDSLAEQLEANPDLRAIETLADQILEDIETLTEWRYIDAYGIDIIHGIYQEEKFAEKDAIAQHADTEEHQVAKLLNDLQGREPPWNQRPLVQEEPERGFSPTSYGYLVGAIVSKHSRTGEDQRVVESDAGRDDTITMLHRYYFADDLDGHRHLQNVLAAQFDLEKQEEPD